MVNRYMWVLIVDQELAALRSHLLGEDLSLSTFVPSWVEVDERVEWLADWLAFQFASKCKQADRKDVLNTKRWLFAAIKYLDEHCSSSDFTLLGLEKLLNMSSSLRAVFFADVEPRDIYTSIRNDLFEPEPLKNTEAVFITLVPEKEYGLRKRKLGVIAECINRQTR